MDYLVRFYMFQITGLFLGVPALCWAACTFHRHRRSSGKDSVFIITLLFSDALQLLLTLLFLASDSMSKHVIFSYLCNLVRLFGLWLHQLVALEVAVSVSHSKHATLLSSRSVCVTGTAQFVVNIVLLLSHSHHTYVIFLIVVPLLNNGVLCFFTCSHKTHQTTSSSITAKMLLAVSMVTYVILYGPYLVTVIIFLLDGREGWGSAYDIREIFIVWESLSFSIVIFRVIADSILVCIIPRITHISQI